MLQLGNEGERVRKGGRRGRSRLAGRAVDVRQQILDRHRLGLTRAVDVEGKREQLRQEQRLLARPELFPGVEPERIFSARDPVWQLVEGAAE